MNNPYANQTRPGYELTDELARLCLPAMNRDSDRKLAWLNSVCILFPRRCCLSTPNRILTTSFRILTTAPPGVKPHSGARMTKLNHRHGRIGRCSNSSKIQKSLQVIALVMAHIFCRSKHICNQGYISVDSIGHIL